MLNNEFDLSDPIQPEPINGMKAVIADFGGAAKWYWRTATRGFVPAVLLLGVVPLFVTTVVLASVTPQRVKTPHEIRLEAKAEAASRVQEQARARAKAKQAVWKEEAKREEEYKRLAPIMSQEFVTRRLKAPATAQFPNSCGDEVLTTRLAYGKFMIASHVDSQNSFGALIRTKYICIVRKSGGDQWLCESVILDE
ncbi:MAG: hypothetical protein H0U60_13200 [Blastocatellia bacterium]|nr:hypothetical protein [Blastocatellia bacterium]